jgi:hypothetical protein
MAKTKTELTNKILKHHRPCHSPVSDIDGLRLRSRVRRGARTDL